MSELSCDTPFIGRNETHDLSRYRMNCEYNWLLSPPPICHHTQDASAPRTPKAERDFRPPGPKETSQSAQHPFPRSRAALPSLEAPAGAGPRE